MARQLRAPDAVPEDAGSVLSILMAAQDRYNSLQYPLWSLQAVHMPSRQTYIQMLTHTRKVRSSSMTPVLYGFVPLTPLPCDALLRSHYLG